MNDLRKFTLDYVCGNTGICARELLGKAHNKYLEVMGNNMSDCPVSNFYDFWKSHIDGKELKDYPLETLFTIINFAYDIEICNSKKLWMTLVSNLKNVPKHEREDIMLRIWPKEKQRRDIIRHIEEDTIPYNYSHGGSNIWIIRNVSINSKLLFSEHCIGNYMSQ